MSSRVYEDLSDRTHRCHAITRYIVGESCKYLTGMETFGLYVAFILVITAAFLLLFYTVTRVISIVNPDPIFDPAAPPPPNYTWTERWGAFRYGGMDRYKEVKRLEEEDRVFHERLKRDGWQSVDIPIIPGWNCAESREKERRIAEQAFTKARDEEEGGVGRDVSPSRMGTELDTIRSSRGGKLSPETSDEESDKQITAKSFGKGSSNSRHGASMRSSKRKGSQINT